MNGKTAKEVFFAINLTMQFFCLFYLVIIGKYDWTMNNLTDGKKYVF